MKIPGDAKCVFKGSVFDVYQWEQELFDGTYSTFEAIKRKHQINVIAVQDEYVFFVEESQPNKPTFRGLISGGAESYGEEPLETAKRELLEETGLVSDHWELLYEDNSTPRMEWPIYTYIAKDCKLVADQNLDSGEKIKIQKVSIDEFCHEVLQDPKFRAYSLKNDIFNTANNGSLDKLIELLKS